VRCGRVFAVVNRYRIPPRNTRPHRTSASHYVYLHVRELPAVAGENHAPATCVAQFADGDSPVIYRCRCGFFDRSLDSSATAYGEPNQIDHLTLVFTPLEQHLLRMLMTDFAVQLFVPFSSH